MRLSEPPKGVRPVCDFKGYKELKVAASRRLAMSLSWDPSKMGKQLTEEQNILEKTAAYFTNKVATIEPDKHMENSYANLNDILSTH